MLQRLSKVVWSTCLAVSLGACGGNESPPAAAEENPHSERGGIGILRQELGTGVVVDARRSLAITDTAITSRFNLGQVLNWLTSGAYVDSQLFRQLWETQNSSAVHWDMVGSSHCSDNGGTLNGFAYHCRPAEGQQVMSSSEMNTYVAVGIYNRFDLAPADGADCGEYRIVFAKTGTTGGRNFIIFEAVLPNPRTDLGLEGCRPVANLLRDLSNIPSASSRGSLLTNFYFGGLGGFGPVISPNNYGNNARGVGQVRTNQFLQQPWLLREFKLKYVCPPGLSCTNMFVPVTVKTNPFGDLFNPSSTHPLSTEFQNSFFPSQVAALATNDINTFNYSVPDKFNVGQSDSQTPGVVDDYVARFGTGPSAFRTIIQSKLAAIGSTLTPEQIIARAQTQSCGGCHQRSNGKSLGGGLTWPASATFVHSSDVTETSPEGGSRFQISPALTNVFLPHRKLVLENYLNQVRTLASNRPSLAAVAARAGHSAWIETTANGYVMSVPAGGSPLVLATNRTAMTGVALDNASVYWSENRNPGEILRVPLRGGAITSVASGRYNVGNLTSDGSYLYWTEGTGPVSIMKMFGSGGTITTVLSGLGSVSALAADATNLYWLEGTNLMKMPKAGGTATLLAQITTNSISSDGTNVYWKDAASGSVQAIPVNGGTISTVRTIPSTTTGIAVDTGYLYWLENGNPGKVMAGPK